MDLKETVRSIVDWPVKGVIFRDLTTLMKDPQALRVACDLFYERYRDKNIDTIVGIDARGFVFGAVLAYKLGVAFVPVRKKGKLPAETIEESYSLEYGDATMEIHVDAVSPGDKVVLIDDLLATGGTIGAALKLIRRCGGEVLECAFVVELPDLGGRKSVDDCGVYALMEFEGE
ncbi:MAG: adenine phosphoribosyltransferase [Deltaproteobacteria bacterium]|nr:MAG: adenine phosphoribosyltransferase [Deltaproteobacteria bacterium]